MKPLHFMLSASIVAALAGCQPKEAAKPAADAASKAASTAASTAAAVTAAATNPNVAPEALDALKRMSAHLATLTSFEVKGDSTIEQVMDDGQKDTVHATTHYLVRRPDGFVIDVSSPDKARKFVYDGKTLTIFAPKLGYYTTVPAPPTIRETIALATEKGVRLPLADLFDWSDPGQARTADLKEGKAAGVATVNGVECDQYAFKEQNVDWQVCIQRGDKPVPLRVEIVDAVDPARPAFVSKLTWNEAPAITATSFAFAAPKGAKAIQMAAAQ